MSTWHAAAQLSFYAMLRARRTPARGSVSLDELVDTWRTTGLRDADLEHVLRDLAARGEVQFGSTYDRVVLTPVGHGHVNRRIYGWREIATHVAALALVAWAHLRVALPRGAAARRATAA